jgi:hypothetical protein
MAQAVSMDAPQAGSSSGFDHDAAHCLGAEGAMRSLDPYKYSPPLGARGTTTQKIGSDRVTDVWGQRETLGAVRLTVHDDFAGSPIDVV